MAQYDEDGRLISDFDEHLIAPNERNLVPTLIERCQANERAVARNSRVVTRDITRVTQDVMALRREIEEHSNELTTQLDNLSARLDGVSNNAENAITETNQLTTAVNETNDNLDEEVAELWQFIRRLEHTVENLVQRYEASFAIFQAFQQQVPPADDIDNWSLGNLSTPSTITLLGNQTPLRQSAATTAQPDPPANELSLADEITAMARQQMPESNQILQNIIEHIQQLRVEDPEYADPNHQLSVLQQELQHAQGDLRQFLPLALTTISTFDGNPKISVRKFLMEVEDDIQTNSTFPLTQTQKVARLKARLRGRARRFFENLNDADVATFELAAEQLKNKFNDELVRRIADSRLMACYQKAGETVHSFSERLSEIITTLMEQDEEEDLERTLAREFKHRLTPRLRAEVLKTNPSTYEEALALALQMEAYLDEIDLISRHVETTTTTTSSQILVAEQPECRYCHKPGHFKRDCYKLKTKLEQQWNYNNRRQRNNNPRSNDRNKPQRFRSNSFPGNRNQNYRNNGNNGNWNNYNQQNDYNNYRNNNYNNNSSRNNSQYSSRNASPNDVRQQQFQNNAAPRSITPPNRPRVTFSAQTLPLTMLLLFACFLPTTAASQTQKPLLCLPDSPSTLWTLNKDKLCNDQSWMPDESLVAAEWQIFRQNTVEYQTEAIHCQCFSTQKVQWSSFFGTISETITTTPMEVTVAECVLMNNTFDSVAGILTDRGEYYSTNNTPIVDRPIWPFSMSPTAAHVTNCYKYKTKIFTRHEIPTINSAFNTPEKCLYQSGACQMREVGVLAWKPDVTQQCQYIHMKTWNGTYSSKIWIAETKDFALSFQEVEIIEDCNQTYVLSEQNFAIPRDQYKQTMYASAKLDRAKRDVGITLSTTLSAELTALQANTIQITKDLFANTFRQICAALQSLAEATISLASSNPTLLARQLLNESSIKAKLVAPRVLAIQSCIPMDYGNIHFIQQSICYNRLPVYFVYQHNKYTAFLDPISMILEADADVVDCKEYEHIYIYTDRLQKFNQISGHSEYVEIDKAITSFKTLDFPVIAVQHNFKNLVLSNISELFNFHNFHSEAVKVQQMHEIMNKMAIEDHPLHGEYQPHLQTFAGTIVSKGIFSFLNGGIFCIWNVWIFLCCTYGTIHFLLHSCFPVKFFSYFKYLNVFTAIKFLWKKIKRIFKKSAPSPKQRTTVGPRTSIVDLQNLLLDTTYPLPPSSRIQDRWPSTQNLDQQNAQQPDLERNQALWLSPEKLSAAHVHGLIENNPATFLFDTGSKATIILQTFVKKHGLKVTYNRPNIGLVGVGGYQHYTNGQVEASVTLGNLNLKLILYVLPHETTYRPSYDVILGEDSFTKMPAITYDYAKKIIHIGNNTMEVMAMEEDAIKQRAQMEITQQRQKARQMYPQNRRAVLINPELSTDEERLKPGENRANYPPQKAVQGKSKAQILPTSLLSLSSSASSTTNYMDAREMPHTNASSHDYMKSPPSSSKAITNQAPGRPVYAPPEPPQQRYTLQINPKDHGNVTRHFY